MIRHVIKWSMPLSLRDQICLLYIYIYIYIYLYIYIKHILPENMFG